MDAAIWATLLLMAGLIVLLLEFVIPSAGVLSVVCALLLISAIVVGFVDSFFTGATVMVVEVVLIPVMIAGAVKLWPHTAMGKRMLLAPPESPDDVLPERLQSRELQQLVGRRGTARSLMLPSGMVDIEGRQYDAMSQGNTIEVGAKVMVVGVSMNSLVVKIDNTIVAELAEDAPEVPRQNLRESPEQQPSAKQPSDNPLDQPMADPFA